MSDNIKVAIKVRPLIRRERDENLPIQWMTQGNTIVAVDPEMKKRGDGGFQFDHIFDMAANNNNIFDSVVKPIVDAAVNGFNGTVFAYGQTSSGKTYTMMGTTEELGVIPLAVEYMFDAIANHPGREFLLRVSYLEIYNERLNDLLSNNTDLKIHEDLNNQVFVKCKEEVTNCPENVLLTMNRGNKNRRIGETNMNERSSRSHTIFRITIESRETGADSSDAIQVSQLNMVDLAGSERARQTGATGERFKEGRHINLSLSTLAMVIKQLSESQDSQKYINFRDSKLTRLLQASLGGNALTAIICAVTPAALEETQCTLSFAARAKIIKNKPELNEVMSDGVLLKRYAKQIAKLHAELERMKQVNWTAEVQEMESKMQEKDRINESLEERIRLLQTRIVAGDKRNNAESFKSKAKRRRTWCGTSGHKMSISSAFQSSTDLSPIREMSPLKSRDKMNNEHFIKSKDIMDISFVAYTDFELELMKNEEEIDSCEDIYVTSNRKQYSVQFKDDVIIHNSPASHDNSNTTPEKVDTCTQTLSIKSPGTPKEDLRRRIRCLSEEYSQLREYTTLEKQLHFEDHRREVEEKLTRFSILEKQLENVTSDKEAFEHIASDLRKKLTSTELRCISAEEKLSAQLEELERVSDLQKKLEQLSAQRVEAQNIPELHKRIDVLTVERDEYEYIAAELRRKLNEAEQHNVLLEDKLGAQNAETDEPLIRFSIENENAQQIELQTHVATLTSEKAELQREISDLRNELTQATLRNDLLTDQLNEQRTVAENVRDFEDQVNSLVSKRSAYEQSDTQSRESRRGTEGVLGNSIRDKLDKWQLDIEKLQEQEERIERLASEKRELELTVGEFKERLVEAEVMATTMRDEINEHQRDTYELLEKQIQDAVTNKMESERTNSELKDKLREMELMNDSMQSKALSGQQLHAQKIHDLEKRIEDLANEKSEFEVAVAELKNRLKDGEVAVGTLTSENSNLSRTISELQEKSKTAESYSNTIEEKLSARQAEAEEAIEQQKKCVESFALERSKLEDTIRELQERSKRKETELQNDLAGDTNEQVQQMQTTRDSEKEIGLTSRTNELESTVHELREKPADISVQDNERLRRIQELEAQVAKLTSDKEEYERTSVELREQSEVESPSAKELVNDRDNDEELRHLKDRITDLQSIIQDVQRENAHLKEQMSVRSTMLDHECDLSGDSSKIMEDLSSTRLSLEDNSSVKLSADLVLKTQELDEIKQYVQGMKEDIENLQKTICLLTTENTELANKLSMEKVCAEKAAMHLQETIDELYARNSRIMSERFEQEGNLAMLKEEVEALRSKMPEVNLNEEQIIQKYEEQINALTAKNTELLCNVTDKMKEIEVLKESKSLLYEHDCLYKEKLTDLMEKHEYLTAENNELSTDLMDKIEENDDLRQECEILRSKLELSLRNKEDIGDNGADQLITENTLLKTELIGLKANVKTLSEENSKKSNQLMEIMEDLDNTRKTNSCNNSLHLTTLFDNTLTTNGATDRSVMDDDPETRISNLQEEVNHLTHLNRKLSDLKLSTCAQCSHLRELNENRRMLKLEVKSLNHKLADLQRKFDRKSAKTDALILKAKEDINASLCNSSFNVSFSENMNVSYVEEKLQVLHKELQTLKENHDELSDLYKEKCEEVEELQNSNISSSIVKSPCKMSSRLNNIVKVMNNLQDEFQEIKQNNLSVRADLDKFTNERQSLMHEITSLRTANEELLEKLSESELSLTTATEKADILENEATEMTKKLQEFIARSKEIENSKLLLEVEAETLKEDKITKERTMGELRQNLSSLQHEIDLMKREKEELDDSNSNLEQEYEKKLESLKMLNEELINSKATISREFADYSKESESRALELDEKINKYTSENDYLKRELIRLRDIESKFEKMRDDYQSKSQQDKTLAEDNKRLKEMLNVASTDIIKEIKSLKPKTGTKQFLDKSLDELFRVFLETVLAKEKEIVKTMQAHFDKERQKLEDEKQQSVDAEKRMALWTKELESEIEKLQGDLSEREGTSADLRREIARLQELLEENNRDRDTLREKIDLLEADLGNLQVELVKYTKNDTVNEEAIVTAQKRERQAQEAIKSKEAEFQLKLKSEKEAYNKRVEELACTIESFKTRNMELTSNIEGLEANQKQFKNIIDLKTNELMKSNQVIQKMQTESEQFAEAYNDLNHELEEKNLRVATITELLKTKCDQLTEYKANLETIVSENKFLKQQIDERRTSVEQHKTEIETLKMANERAIDAIKDKLSLEELKSVELNRRITELNSKNDALTEEMGTLRGCHEELQDKCVKLEKRVRNSTSKIQAEERMEELKDMNRSLRNNLDGASNRITELQTAKSDLMRQLVALNGQYDAACKENEELKETLTSRKYRHHDANAIGEKYDALLREKNQIALELEAAKVQLNLRNEEIKELAEKNTELDRESEELADVIRQNDAEHARLQDQFYACRIEIDALQDNIKALEKRNQSVLPQSALRANVSTDRAERPHDDFCVACATLKNKIRELQLEVVSRNGKIATLELQIRSGSFPYQAKCNELQEHLSAYSNKNSELKAEIKRLQLTMLRVSAKECDLCKQRLVNRKNQACQTMPSNVVRFCSTSSGIIEDDIRIMKLEKEKMIMKDVCRSRSKTIKELEKRIEELLQKT